MGALTGVRQHITDALAEAEIPVHTYPVGAPTPPYLMLIPGSPYLTPGAAFASQAVAIDVRVAVNPAAGPAAAHRLDELLDLILPLLYAAGVQVDSVPAPIVTDDGPLICDIPTTTVWKDET